MMDDTEEVIKEEIEILESIFIHELEINDGDENFVRTIKANLRPATGEDSDAQWVCMELWLQVPPGYPDVSPVVTIRNARGLSEQRVQKLKDDLIEEAQGMLGMQVLFQLIQHGIDFLTSDNMPDCPCSICLYRFMEADVLVKTACFHYFHEHCLSRYVKFQLEEIREQRAEARRNNSPLKEVQEIVCPMCRLGIPETLVPCETDAPPPVEQSMDADFHLTPQLRDMQRRMETLFIRQKEKGGIIDIEGEKNKFFIQISNAADEEDGSQSTAKTEPQVCREPPNVQRGQAQSKVTKKQSSDSSESEDGGNCGRVRNKRGRGRMYPSLSDKKRAHTAALQKMGLQPKHKEEIEDASTKPLNPPLPKLRQKPNGAAKKNS